MNIIFFLLILFIILILIYFIYYNKFYENFYTALSDNAKNYRDIANSYEEEYKQLLLDIEEYKKIKEDKYNDFIKNDDKKTYYNYFIAASNNLSINTNKLHTLLNSKNIAINNAINAENLAAIETAEIAAKTAAEIAAKIIADTKAESDAKAIEIIKTEEKQRENANKIAKEKADIANDAKQKADLAKSIADIAKIEADNANNDAQIAKKNAEDALAYANLNFDLDGIPSNNININTFSNKNNPLPYNKNENFFAKI